MTEIQERLEKLAETKAQVIARVRALPEDQREVAPDSHSFTPAELIDHLARTDESYADEIDASHVGDAAKPSHRWLYKYLLTTLRQAKKIKVVPSFFRPSEGVKLEVAEKHWEGAHVRLRQALWEASPDQVLFHHSLFGNMSAQMILDLTEAHLHYHDVHFPVQTG